MSSYLICLPTRKASAWHRKDWRYAQKLLENNQAEVKIGAVAQYDVLRSQEEVSFGDKSCWWRKTPFPRTPNR